MSIIVTGGCGFIGSNFIDNWTKITSEPVINIDCLTYASKPPSSPSDKVIFYQLDLNERKNLQDVIYRHAPRAIIHFAAETHVDRSIVDVRPFIHSNINGTATLLDAALSFWRELNDEKKHDFRFINISTDEVYGTLLQHEEAFSEASNLNPNNPYSASKASADLLVRSYWKTYGFPSITTRCSNNFGPFQHKEKLIPHVVSCIAEQTSFGIYGNGKQIREWLYVADHTDAICRVLEKGKIGLVYNIGGGLELSNLELVQKICENFDNKHNQPVGHYFNSLARFVDDRPGHDFRYALDCSLITEEIGWRATHNFETALKASADWHFDSYCKS